MMMTDFQAVCGKPAGMSEISRILPRMILTRAMTGAGAVQAGRIIDIADSGNIKH